MVIIEDFEMPKSCFSCRKRKCLYIDGKAYQMCGLNEDGYLTESWFNSENIPIDYRSEHCPLREVEAIPKAEYEARLKENNELVNDLEQLRTMINKFAESYEHRLKADLVAMLEELDLQLDEMKIIRPQHNMPKYQIDPYRHGVNDSKKKIQQKINSLKED